MNISQKFVLILFSCLVAISASSIDEETQQQNDTSTNSTKFGVSGKAEILHRKGYHVVVHNMDCKCDLDVEAARKRDDYQYTAGIGAHKFHTKATTFNEARKICNEEGGHLVIIDCNEEAEVLTELAKNSDPVKGAAVGHGRQGWIGIHDLFAEGEWVTILGNSLYEQGYNKWTTVGGGQPNNADGIEHCGSYLYGYEEGGMNDLACNITEPFFCEIPEILIC